MRKRMRKDEEHALRIARLRLMPQPMLKHAEPKQTASPIMPSCGTSGGMGRARLVQGWRKNVHGLWVAIGGEGMVLHCPTLSFN